LKVQRPANKQYFVKHALKHDEDANGAYKWDNPPSADVDKIEEWKTQRKKWNAAGAKLNTHFQAAAEEMIGKHHDELAVTAADEDVASYVTRTNRYIQREVPKGKACELALEKARFLPENNVRYDSSNFLVQHMTDSFGQVRKALKKRAAAFFAALEKEGDAGEGKQQEAAAPVEVNISPLIMDGNWNAGGVSSVKDAVGNSASNQICVGKVVFLKVIDCFSPPPVTSLGELGNDGVDSESIIALFPEGECALVSTADLTKVCKRITSMDRESTEEANDLAEKDMVEWDNLNAAAELLGVNGDVGDVEFLETVAGLSEKFKKMFAKVDEDHLGKVSLEEFVKIVEESCHICPNFKTGAFVTVLFFDDGSHDMYNAEIVTDEGGENLTIKYQWDGSEATVPRTDVVPGHKGIGAQPDNDDNDDDDDDDSGGAGKRGRVESKSPARDRKKPAAVSVEPKSNPIISSPVADPTDVSSKQTPPQRKIFLTG